MTDDKLPSIESICRVICEAEGVNPDHHGHGAGHQFKQGQKFKLWEARKRVAKVLMKEFEIVRR